MFTNIEKKLKTLAQINFVCGIILAIVCPILGNEIAIEVGAALGFMIGLAWLFVGGISSWFIYGFAELLENTKEMNRILKIGYAEDISKDAEQKQEAERRLAEEEEVLRQRNAEAQRIAEQQLKEAEAAKQARIVAYWEKHPDEQKALLEKRIDAENRLKEMGRLAGKQRKALQDLIQAIDEELMKDRES